MRILWMLLLFVSPVLAQSVSDARKLSNLEAFARLYGYVRYFHPSDQTAEVEWDKFVVYGVGQVADAADDGDLHKRLDQLFNPIAPTLVIYPTGSKVDDPKQPLPEDKNGLEQVAWRHLGVNNGQAGVYQSGRSNRPMPFVKTAGFGTVTQLFTAEKVRGKTLRYSFDARGVAPGSATGHGWLRVDRPNRQMGFFDNMGDRYITTKEWQRYTIEGHVDSDALNVAFGFFVRGDGDFHADNFKMEVKADDGSWQEVPIKNGDFSASETEVTDWSARSPGYLYKIVKREDDPKNPCLFLGTSDEMDDEANAPFQELPPADAMIDKPLNAGLSVKMLVSLYSQNDRTLGAEDKQGLTNLKRALASSFPVEVMKVKDLATRAGAVIQAWNLMQHFYPYWHVIDTDWQKELTIGLKAALPQQNKESFNDVLNRMIAKLHDGHARVNYQRLPSSVATLPFAVDWIEDKVVVVVSNDERVLVGDVITSMQGKPVKAYLAAREQLVSGSPQWHRFRLMREFSRGDAGEEVNLTLVRGNQKQDLTMKRDFQGNIRERQRKSVETLEEGIMYVDLDIAEMAAIKDHLEALAAAKGIVFDMRGYPRGTHEVLAHLTDQNMQSPEWKIPKYLMPDQEGLTYHTSSWPVAPLRPRFKGKAVFLTDGGAISYAETFMSFVSHYKLGEIIGEPTAGANGNVNSFGLPGGYQVRWTGMRVDLHEGGQLHTKGIQPTVPIKRTLAAVREGRDEYIEKAVALIKQ